MLFQCTTFFFFPPLFLSFIFAKRCWFFRRRHFRPNQTKPRKLVHLALSIYSNAWLILQNRSSSRDLNSRIVELLCLSAMPVAAAGVRGPRQFLPSSLSLSLSLSKPIRIVDFLSSPLSTLYRRRRHRRLAITYTATAVPITTRKCLKNNLRNVPLSALTETFQLRHTRRCVRMQQHQ
jgi:hypothetical protein